MKTLELDERAKRFDCDIRKYADLSISMVMLQGWFNDQYDCFELFFEQLTCDERLHIFTDEECLESAKDTYKELWYGGALKKVGRRYVGEHKRLKQLTPGNMRYRRRGFSYWATCVFSEAYDSGGLGKLLQILGTVEQAHCKFKPWFYSSDIVRGLNAADAARILARYGYLQPESRPLLARGAHRGTAIVLDDQPHSKTIVDLDGEYGDEMKRTTLEQKAALHIDNSGHFSGKFRMEEGESWFCSVQKAWR